MPKMKAATFHEPEKFTPAWNRSQVASSIGDAEEGMHELESQGERISFLDCCDDMVGDGISDIMGEHAPRVKYGTAEYVEKFNALAEAADSRAGFGGKLLKRLKMKVTKK